MLRYQVETWYLDHFRCFEVCSTDLQLVVVEPAELNNYAPLSAYTVRVCSPYVSLFAGLDKYLLRFLEVNRARSGLVELNSLLSTRVEVPIKGKGQLF
ncbi:unnamed protein product [Boreogadus saida]